MHALADALEERAEEFAQIESLDNGKPVGLAQYVDVAGAVGHLRYFAGWPTKIEGGVLPVSAPEHARLHAPRTRRRRGPDHPLELPAADGRLEARPGARGRLHDRAEAGRADAAERAAARRAGARGRLPAGRPQRPHRRRRDRRGARRPPRRRQDRLHRLDGRRPRDRLQGGSRAQARDARARRQVAEHHPPRRRHRGRRQGLLPGDLLQLRPGLQRRLAPVRARPTATTRWSQALADAAAAATQLGPGLDARHPARPARLRRAAGARPRLHRVRRARRAPRSSPAARPR